MDILLIALGLAGLLLGGDTLVRGAVSLAQIFRVSPLLIGLTIVGFGTSAPELVTSVQAAFAGAPGLAIGNVVGSNIANILLILGLTACFAPIIVAPAAFRRDGLALAVITLGTAALLSFGTLGRGVGFALLAALVLYLVETYRQDRNTPLTDDDTTPALPIWRALGLTALGLVGIIIAARLLVTGAINTAAALGVSDTVIGLTVVAIGTSLPELVTSVIAIRKGQGALAFGNVLGSNIFNLAGILGVTAVITPLTVPPEIISRDLLVLLAATGALLVFAVTGWRIARREGAALLVGFVGYTIWLISGATA